MTLNKVSKKKEFLKLPVQMYLKVTNNASVKLLLKMSPKFPYQLQSYLRVAIFCVLQNLQEEIYGGVCFNIFRTI